MGMGYGANYADVIEEKALDKIVKGKVKELKEALGEDYDLESLAREIEFDEGEIEEPLFGKADKIYHEIQETFKKETGLELALSFHDSDEDGDRYDQVNGAFWEVFGMYELTPAGKKLEKKVPRLYYVSFG